MCKKKKKEKKRQQNIQLSALGWANFLSSVCMRVCVCVCVWVWKGKV